jgi:hypothetical protein
VTKAYTNEEDARKVCDGDINLHWLGGKFSENIPSGIVTKPPKPVSSVSAVPTWGIFRIFWVAFIERLNFLRSLLDRALVCKGEVALQNH